MALSLLCQIKNHMDVQTLLKKQLRKVSDDTRKAKRQQETYERSIATLTEKLQELQMYNSAAQTEVKTLVKQKEEVMVDENVLGLEIRRLRNLLNSSADSVLS